MLPSLDAHDWVLWLFENLQQPQKIGNNWKGVLPDAFAFNDVLNALPSGLAGETNEMLRTIEFDPIQFNVFENLNELVRGRWRREVPLRFSVRDLSYIHGKSEIAPKEISNYLVAVRLWKYLFEFSDYQRDHSAVFIKSFESKIEIRAEYGFGDLIELKDFSNFAETYFVSQHHKEQKRNIVRASLLESFKGELNINYSNLLQKFDDFVERVKASYSLYTADFSFEKLRSEVDKQNVDDTLRVNKVLSEIQNQLLAVPAAMLVAGASAKAGILTINISIVLGLTVFSWLMSRLIENQLNSLSSIKYEIDQRTTKIKAQPRDISEKVLPLFEVLEGRLDNQKLLLKKIRLVVWWVWLGTMLLVAFTHFSSEPISPPDSVFSSGFE
jgi:hypothetical protein